MPAQTNVDNTEDLYDLCIIGAGISGLNALYSALHYLPQSARVLLVDRNPTSGGMWTQTYDIVTFVGFVSQETNIYGVFGFLAVARTLA